MKRWLTPQYSDQAVRMSGGRKWLGVGSDGADLFTQPSFRSFGAVFADRSRSYGLHPIYQFCILFVNSNSNELPGRQVFDSTPQ